MKYGVVVTTLFAGLIGAGATAASPVTPSPLALPIVEIVPVDPVPPAPAYAQQRSWYSSRHGSRYDATSWRRRRYPPPDYPEPGYSRAPSRPTTFSQIHMGFMDINGVEAPGFLFGFRGGLAADPMVQIGGELDWRHRGDSETQVISRQVGPGGSEIVVHRDLARSSSDLVPLMATLQVGGGAAGTASPYVGIGGGVEVLHLSAEDFQTGEKFDGTFTGLGWQAFGGVAFPLSSQTRLNAEVFYNGGELSRDVDDPTTGETFRESVLVNGAGARAGFSFLF
jgi:opacity protein-like surface antigen